MLSFCIVKNLKGKRALSFQQYKWLHETILSPTRDDDLLPSITKSFSNYENPQDLEPSFIKHQGQETGTATGHPVGKVNIHKEDQNFPKKNPKKSLETASRAS